MSFLMKKEKESYASNQMNEKKDPTAHAELIAIRKACRKLKKEKLTNLSIFTIKNHVLCVRQRFF